MTVLRHRRGSRESARKSVSDSFTPRHWQPTAAADYVPGSGLWLVEKSAFMRAVDWRNEQIMVAVNRGFSCFEIALAYEMELQDVYDIVTSRYGQ
jgi:hypothetical protein